ncbi:MHC class II regulatory factor RFX1 [Copidosoma floridanum]|uniref:MHC class II regulatory factor RFX1 n=1 Tax=Copidosoma floridanum TaxID=29053 RepID=UPI0006C97B80|nr:MHC class II regulatory factor RFX1 [Copidosoma floridanum]
MTTSSGKNQQETKPQPPPEPSDPIPPPPPPKISSPSPPPPPRIFAEDLKQGKKRKNSPERSEHEEDSKDPKRGLEPLPPGVDSPEVAYTLPASALEAGVLYGAQQTNPIYAATLAGAAAAAGIPLLQHHHHHHHTALMQGQLVHYNSAYHQHLHNQALVAARLTGQEAVQFMVAAEYARVYENNQVIAKPPVKMTQESSMGSALNSFYSDIASIEHTAETERERIEAIANVPSPVPQVPHTEVDAVVLEAMKEKKKKKMKTGIGKKQKEMSSMVAKWQRAQKNYKD